MSPFIRQTASGYWEAGVPRYGEDLKEGEEAYYRKLFASESQAMAWVKALSGAGRPIYYPAANANVVVWAPGYDSEYNYNVVNKNANKDAGNWISADIYDDRANPVPYTKIAYYDYYPWSISHSHNHEATKDHKHHDVRLGSGVEKVVNHKGHGHTPHIGEPVTIFYVGMFLNGQIFDKSFSPLSFTLGAGQVIECLDIAVSSMKVGERATVTCPSHTAFGPEGKAPFIPADAPLRFEIHRVKLARALEYWVPVVPVVHVDTVWSG